MNEELVIDQNNFGEYFRDCRVSKPERGDILAKYSAVAEFVDGPMKKDVINLLQKDKALPATQLFRKIGCTSEKEAVRVCREICSDLISGNTDVEQKPYKYIMEIFYYTKKEYVPVDDPHWSVISLNNLDEFLDKENHKVTIKSRLISPEESHG